MRKVIFWIFISSLLLGGYLLWSLSALIPPILAGIVLAYVFRPLKAKFHIPGLPHEVGVVLAFSFIVIASTLMFFKVKSFMPNDKEKIELKVRLDYKLNKKFSEIFEADSGGSFISMIGKEIKPALNSVSSLLELSVYEEDLLEKSRIAGLDPKHQVSDLYYSYHQMNLSRRSSFDRDREVRRPNAIVDPTTQGFSISSGSVHKKPESKTHFLYAMSLWSLSPLVFLFLIFDNGQIRRYLVRMVPNKYFEVTLTLLDRLDEAIGLYLRGTATECVLVALSMFIGLSFLGLPLAATTLLAVLCGVLNAVPFLGPLLGGLAVLSYALIAESLSPMIPLISLENLPVAVLAVVGVVQVLDNVLFAPVVLGRAVNLHPLVVILSLSAASMLFGVWGVVVTIPTIVVAKTIVQTLFTQFKAYKLLS